MRNGTTVAVVIPALNEEKSIGRVLDAIPVWVDDIVVADNGSRDSTSEVARAHGARTVLEPERGYGAACLRGIAALKKPDVVVFLDGDFSDHPEEMHLLVDPIVNGQVDMVIGSRVQGRAEQGALTPQARFGNWLACTLIRWIWKVEFTDLGPFRAINFSALERLNMSDRDYGWTVEMQIKAARDKLRVADVPVSYRQRIGKSKVSGTVRGVVGAGTKILGTIFLAALRPSWYPTQRARRERIILFTRYPHAGTTKTRLIPELGPERAAELQRAMTEHVLRRVRRLQVVRDVDVEIRFEGGSRDLMEQWLGTEVSLSSQGDGDLGQRLERVVSDSFRSGIDRILIIGSDSPGVTPEIMASALDALGSRDAVIGPATDGGYYLIGLKDAHVQLFQGIPWGTDQVCSRTLEQARRLALSFRMLEPLGDVDRPEDLSIWEQECGTPEPPGVTVAGREARETGSPSVSVIIPTVNEESFLGATLKSVLTEEGVEILVVDGRSTDGTVQLARELGAAVLRSPRGRSVQLNRGAAQARGNILLFLHADTILPMDWQVHVKRTLQQPGVVAGAFAVRFDEETSKMRLIERLTNFRARRLQMPYGDQAIFLSAVVFRRIGGFPDLPIMEDFQLCRNLKKKGRIAIVPEPVLTSARICRKVGPIRNTLINQLVILLFFFRVPPKTVAGINRVLRGNTRSE